MLLMLVTLTLVGIGLGIRILRGLWAMHQARSLLHLSSQKPTNDRARIRTCNLSSINYDEIDSFIRTNENTQN